MHSTPIKGRPDQPAMAPLSTLLQAGRYSLESFVPPQGDQRAACRQPYVGLPDGWAIQGQKSNLVQQRYSRPTSTHVSLTTASLGVSRLEASDRQASIAASRAFEFPEEKDSTFW